MLNTIIIVMIFIAAIGIWVRLVKNVIEEFRSPCCKKPMKQKYNYTFKKMIYRCTYCNKDIL